MKNMFIGPWYAIIGKSDMQGMNWRDGIFLIAILASILFVGHLLGSFNGNPIRYVPNNRFWIALLLVIAFLSIGGMMSRGALEIENVSPHMIVSFELAKTETHAQKIIDTWKDNFALIKGKNIPLDKVAQKDIKMDFGFIVVYVALLGFLSFWVADYLSDTRIATLGIVFGWSSVIAGLFDMVENIALLNMLANGATNKLAQIAFWTAFPKLIITLWVIVPFILIFGLFSLGSVFLIKK